VNDLVVKLLPSPLLYGFRICIPSNAMPLTHRCFYRCKYGQRLGNLVSCSLREGDDSVPEVPVCVTPSHCPERLQERDAVSSLAERKGP
jgi:hypothetical protein